MLQVDKFYSLHRDSRLAKARMKTRAEPTVIFLCNEQHGSTDQEEGNRCFAKTRRNRILFDG